VPDARTIAEKEPAIERNFTRTDRRHQLSWFVTGGGSGFGCGARALESADDVGGGESGNAVDDMDRSTVASHGFAFDAILAVLGAVDVHVRTDLREQRSRVGLVEDVNVIDHAK